MKSFKSISDFYRSLAIPAPQHPLISVLDVATVPHANHAEPVNMTMNFYSIAVKRMSNVRVKYGQQSFDFNDGIMSFIAPNQVFSMTVDNKDETTTKSGWVMYIHPDFIWNTTLAKTIRHYDFWDYSLNETLWLSEKEEAIVSAIMQNIRQECEANIDAFSKPIIISHIETLLNYADRFYNRQFLTREKAAHQILDRLETLLESWFTHTDLADRGLPTVRYVADQLNLSPKYLSNLLRVLTGQTTQQHIHDKLIEKAKEKLSTTDLTVSEIAYELGFEHLPSFSKLFKTRTQQTPMAFRTSFN